MYKVYRSSSIVCITVNINGASIKVKFRPTIGYFPEDRGSIYRTNNKDIQDALESRAGFGTTFWIDDDMSENQDTLQTTEPQTPQLQVVKVSSISDAKLWLIDNKGWTPKGRITKKSLTDVASDYGLVFEGID